MDKMEKWTTKIRSLRVDIMDKMDSFGLECWLLNICSLLLVEYESMNLILAQFHCKAWCHAGPWEPKESSGFLDS